MSKEPSNHTRVTSTEDPEYVGAVQGSLPLSWTGVDRRDGPMLSHLCKEQTREGGHCCQEDQLDGCSHKPAGKFRVKGVSMKKARGFTRLRGGRSCRTHWLMAAGRWWQSPRPDRPQLADPGCRVDGCRSMKQQVQEDGKSGKNAGFGVETPLLSSKQAFVSWPCSPVSATNAKMKRHECVLHF